MEEAVRYKICEEYKTIYQEENFYLCGSCLVNVPVLQYFINIQYEQECGLDLLEKAIMGCLEQGIGDRERICYLLGIDKKMLDFSLQVLENDGCVSETEDGLQMTQTGKEIYRKRSRHISTQEDEICCFNGLTGKWMNKNDLENHQLINLKERKTPENEIWLDVLCFAHFEEDREMSKRALARLYDEQGKHLTGLNINPDYTIRYHSYLLLLYKNRKQDCRMLCVDGCGNPEYETEQGVSKVVKELYDDRQLMEIARFYEEVQAASLDGLLEHYEYLKGENDAIDALVELLLQQRESVEHKTKWVSNQEMRQAFLDSLKDTEKCLYIISPWMNEAVVTEEVLADMEAILDKGAEIHIIYGIETKRQLQGKRDKRNVYTEKIAAAMKERFADYGERFTVTHGSTHEKILISDRKYCISGSLNFLSYDGGEKENYAKGEFRSEGGFCCYDEEVIQHVIDIHFR